MTDLLLFAQRRNNDVDPVIFVIVGIIYLGIIAVFLIPTIAGMWKVNEKAGEPGWAAIVPIYNMIVAFRVAGMDPMWILVMFIPCFSIIPAVMLSIKTAEKFGKDAGFGVAMFFVPFICYPILGFGSAEYEGGRKFYYDDEDDDYDDE